VDPGIERFGGPIWIGLQVGTAVALAVFGLVALIHSVHNHQGGLVGAFWVVFVALALASALLRTHSATLSSKSRLVFRSVLRRKTFWVEDIQRVDRRGSGEGGWHYRFRFNRGTASLQGRPGRALADRLRQLNSRLSTDDDD
jgi:hypothetical protein